jgi:CheY-like chemotaxis protein
MRDETVMAFEEPWTELRLDQLQTLARLERRAETLRAELAALQELLTCVLRQADPWAAAPPQLRGSETILIADDQVVVRAITQGMLESFGYRVLVTAADARLESYATDLVLLDVPIWNGRTHARMRQIRAHSVSVVVSTPLPLGPARLQMQQAGAGAFVSKPFDPLALARCIRQVLDVVCRRES